MLKITTKYRRAVITRFERFNGVPPARDFAAAKLAENEIWGSRGIMKSCASYLTVAKLVVNGGWGRREIIKSRGISFFRFEGIYLTKIREE